MAPNARARSRVFDKAKGYELDLSSRNLKCGDLRGVIKAVNNKQDDGFELDPLTLTLIMNLDLSSNRIRSLSSRFVSEMWALTILDLRNNRLQELPQNFGLLNHLVYLDVRKNKLKTLPLSMARMSSLNFLYVDGNPLQAPLKNLLEQETSKTSGLSTAKIVIDFLKNLCGSSETEACLEASSEDSEVEVSMDVDLDLDLDSDGPRKSKSVRILEPHELPEGRKACVPKLMMTVIEFAAVFFLLKLFRCLNPSLFHRLDNLTLKDLVTAGCYILLQSYGRVSNLTLVMLFISINLVFNEYND